MKPHVTPLIALLFVSGPSLSDGAAEDVPPAEAAARKADADWSAEALDPSVDAWMSFYANDAIVLLPQGRVASGTASVREAVSSLLALPHLSVAWRPIEAAVTRSGDLALLTEAYELRYEDSHGVAVADRGRRLEVWRKQADGSSKCVVDSWDLDALDTAASVAPTQSAPQAAAAPAPARTEPELPESARDPAAKYGAMPAHYEEAIRTYFLLHLKHAESVRYRDIGKPERGYTTGITGGFLMREKHEYGWTVKATIDAKDSHDSYVGFKTYTFLFRGERIVDARLPLPGDEMN